MPKAATEKTNKRPATGYALFVKVRYCGQARGALVGALAYEHTEQMPIWKEKNPNKKHTEAMKEIATLWKDHPSNPNRGKTAAEKKAAPKKAAPKKKAKKVEEDEEADEE
ncbi:hypothetical protein BKA62DRAFT_776202 [Auriculariales sp. MPI-PUGE-AT-0066]|nr:hypothetical protein BKA62DRAFT_776202 [Auriculariales sp. MPI-PUGE-AT-0066]